MDNPRPDACTIKEKSKDLNSIEVEWKLASKYINNNNLNVLEDPIPNEFLIEYRESLEEQKENELNWVPSNIIKNINNYKILNLKMNKLYKIRLKCRNNKIALLYKNNKYIWSNYTNILNIKTLNFAPFLETSIMTLKEKKDRQHEQ